MTRLQRILAFVLAGQLILTAIVFWPRAEIAAQAEALFPDLETENVARIAIEDEAGQMVELTRDGESWVLADRGNFPADSSKVDPILTKIAGLQTGRLVAQSTSSHRRLKVADDDFNRRVELEMADGTTHILYVGTSPGSNTTHVRRAGEQETFLVNDLATWELGATPASWIDTTYININREEVTQIILENKNGTFHFDKQDDDTWTMAGLAEGESLNMSNFNPILNQAVSLRMVAPLGLEEEDAYGLDEPQARLTIIRVDSEDGSESTTTLLVGAMLPDEANYAVKWSEAAYYASVAEFSVQNMIERTREELIELPPTPAPDETTPAADETPSEAAEGTPTPEG